MIGGYRLFIYFPDKFKRHFQMTRQALFTSVHVISHYLLKLVVAIIHCNNVEVTEKSSVR